jgi:phage recombination protein Bet
MSDKSIDGPKQPKRLVTTVAGKYGVDPDKLLVTLKATAFKTTMEVSNEQMMALLVVADQYDLNPFTREIYAFPDKKNGIIPVVGVDGWSRIINSNPAFDGLEFRESETLVVAEEHKPCPEWIECLIYRKDRRHAISVRERFAECYRPPFKGKDGYEGKGPWQTHTSRFLRHKAMIQAARVAFGFVGIYDPDEAERMREVVDLGPATVVPATQSKKALSADHALDAFAVSDLNNEKEFIPNDIDA